MLLLIILDGWGYSEEKYGNAVVAAKTPFLDGLKKRYPNSLLETSGGAVGLPKGQMGGSEVGHLTIGAGRIIFQKLTEIDESIKSGSFLKNKIFLEKLKQLKKGEKFERFSVHFLGLFSEGGIHSSINHLKALLKTVKNEGISNDNIYIHAFLDGRDVSPSQGIVDLEEWKKGESIPIASLMGRYYAMDRDRRWERTEIAYNALINGIGEKSGDLIKSLKKNYQNGITDEFVKPILRSDKFQPIQDGDLVVFYNFRPDRARQLSLSLSKANFLEFKRIKHPKIEILSLVEYDKDFDFPALFPTEEIKETLGEVLSKNRIRQARIAETEKYAHVTYFFNGGREETFSHEERFLIPSPKVATYDLKPEMSAFEITDKLIEVIKSQKYGFILVNYANLDMVGHTGNFKATVKAVEIIDDCIKKIFESLNKNDKIIITADHGNAEKVINEKGETYTAHTTNPVPFIYISNQKSEAKNGGLSDIAPTILDIMNIEKPSAMTGKSLIKNSQSF